MPGVDSIHKFAVEESADGSITVLARPSALKDHKRAPVYATSDFARDSRTFVVVGGGAAGFSCVDTLRKEGYQGRLVLVCQEAVLPYDRTKISKGKELEKKIPVCFFFFFFF
jgi:NADH dehydrogenase FAD-containing subunit